MLFRSWTTEGLVSGGLYDSHMGRLNNATFLCLEVDGWERGFICQTICSFELRKGYSVNDVCGLLSGCRPYSIAPCEHHVNGTRPPCTGEEGDTPKCSKACEAGYTPTYKKDKHFGEGGIRTQCRHRKPANPDACLHTLAQHSCFAFHTVLFTYLLVVVV